MPEPSSSDGGALVKELIELYDFWLQALSPRYNEMVSDHKLYLGHRDDRRKAHEKWRSFSWLGDPFRLTTVETNAWLEITSSLDEWLQAEGVGTEDEWKAKGYVRYGDYFLRGNKWTGKQESLYRNLSYRGWQPIKTGWREIKCNSVRRPSIQERRDFDTSISEALKGGYVTEPPKDADPDAWKSWYEDNSALYPNTPKPLAPMEVETVSYRGPWMYYPSPFSLVFDPYLEDLTETKIFFQRVVKQTQFAKEKIEAGEFDEAAVKEAGTGTDENRLTRWDRDIAVRIGLTANENDPMYKKGADEYLEVWRPHSAEPYLIIMNRKAIVNRNRQNPFWHKQLPYHFIKNIPVSGHPFGLSSYHQLRKSFQDRLTFRDLMLDGLLLAVLPVFLKARSMGMTEKMRELSPGSILDVPDVNGFKPGWQGSPGFAELMQTAQALLGDQQSLSNTGENVAGQAATVGRVSATEATSRLQQALVPHKKKAERLEEEESAMLPQLFYNAYQYLPNDDPMAVQLRAEIVGEDEQDPLLDPRLTRETFAEALAINIKFRGATTKLNKELQAQQLKDFLATVAQVQSASGMPVPIASPTELRSLAKRIYETYGMKGMPQVFTAEGDQAVMQATQAYMLQAQAAPMAVQSQILQLQQAMQQLMNPQPAVDPNTGQPVQQEQQPQEQAQEQPQEAPVA